MKPHGGDDANLVIASEPEAGPFTHLWIDEPFRGRGFGRQLVEAAEQEAADAGAQGCFLSTFDFQAPGFYRRLGYEVYGELVDYPPGHTTYHFRKWLPRR